MTRFLTDGCSSRIFSIQWEQILFSMILIERQFMARQKSEEEKSRVPIFGRESHFFLPGSSRKEKQLLKISIKSIGDTSPSRKDCKSWERKSDESIRPKTKDQKPKLQTKNF